jgi:hypothetical protein
MVALMRDRDRFQRVPAGYQPEPNGAGLHMWNML